MTGAVGNVSAEVPDPEIVDIQFTLCLLPINQAAYLVTSRDGEEGFNTTVYVPPTLSYHDGATRVDLEVMHGQSKKKLKYRGAPTLNFYKKGSAAGAVQQVASVKINPEWKNVLLIAISDPRGKGKFKMLAMNYDGLRLESGEIYVYNLTSDKVLSAIGNVKHRLHPGRFQRFECNLSTKRSQPVIVAAQREGGLKRLFHSNIAFSRIQSNLLIVYYEHQNPDRPRVQLVRDISL